MSKATLFRARVPTTRLRKAEKVFARLGMKASDAFNVFLAQVELRGDIRFTITSRLETLITTQEQGKLWDQALGEY